MIHRLGIHSHWHQCKVVTVWIPVAENPVYIFMLTISTTWSWNTSFGWWMFKKMLYNYHCVNWNKLFYMFYDSPWYITLLTSCIVPSLRSPPILHHWNWPGYIIRYIWTVSEKWSTPVNSFFHAFCDAWHRYLRLLGLLDGKWVAFSVHLNMLPSQMWHRIIESLKLVNASKIIESNCNVSSVQKNASNKDAARERASPIPLWLYAEWEQWVNSGIRLPDYIWSNACNITMLALLKAFGQEDTQILPSVPLGVKDDVCHEHSSIWQRLHTRNSFYQLQAVPPTGSGEWTQAGPSWLRKSLECELTASSLGGKLCENHIPVLEKPDEGVMWSHRESISASRSNWRRNSRISRHSKGEIKRCHVRNNISWTRTRLREKHFSKKKPLYCFLRAGAHD